MQKLAKIALWALSIVMASPVVAFAADKAADAAVSTGLPYMGFAIGAGIAVGFAGLGCGIGQGLTAGNTTGASSSSPATLASPTRDNR